MKRLMIWIVIFSCPALACEESLQPQLPMSYPGLESRPALDQDFPDPMILAASDGWYYAYGTGFADARGVVRTLSVSRSRDLKSWSEPVEAMPLKAEWSRNSITFWGPHAVEANGMYYLFYSAQPWWSTTEKNLRIGVAVSTSPMGPFEDRGHLDTGNYDVSIDPMVFNDPRSGKIYLYWGRNGILTVQELSADLLSFAPGSEAVELLAPIEDVPYESVIEAPYVVENDGYYYMFYSGDDCCIQPHYGVMVARSKSPTGPFVRLSQQPNRNGDGLILRRNSRWIAPGHNSVFRDLNGHWWTVYHAIDHRKSNIDGVDFVRRVMMINALEFRNGWPEVTGDHRGSN